MHVCNASAMRGPSSRMAANPHYVRLFYMRLNPNANHS